MDDVERAIIYVFDESGAAPRELKEQAQQYCAELKRLPNSWQIFLERADTSSYDGVRFWCLSALQELLRAQYTTMASEQRLAIKHKLTLWLRRPLGRSETPLPAFLRNKIAQLVVFVVQLEYPKQWPNFFSDLLGMLGEGPLAVDMFCRVLTAIDQDVVSLEIPRTPAEVQQSMALKDAMRESCIGAIVDACIGLISTLHSSNATLAAAVLEAVARYINWIDISLVANDRFVPMLFGLLHSETEALQIGAAEVLTEIVSKRMDAEAKLKLLQQLGLAPVAAAWKKGLPGNAEGELPLKAAQLLSALCNEILDSWKKVENAVVSLSSVGLSVDNEAASEAQEAVALAQSLLHELLPAVLATVRDPDEDVRLVGVPFLQLYTNKLRNTLKRVGALPEEHRQHIEPILEAIATSLQYPNDAPAVEPTLEPDKSEWEETAELLAERRQELLVLFKNLAKLAPENITAFLGAQLQQKFLPSASFSLEVAVTLLYEAGEGANDEMSKPGCGALGQLALALMQVDAAHASHRLVSLALMETYVRYNRVLAQNPSVLRRILSFFLGNNGIGHADDAVGARACYLFSRLVKAVRSSLNPLIADLLSALQPHLDRIATSPRPEPPSATRSPSGLSSTTDDRLYAHEAAGLLVGSEDLPEEQQLACLGALMQPLLSQIQQNLPAVQKTQLANGRLGHQGETLDPAEGLVVQALEGLSRLSKGLTLQLCTVKRPAVGESLAAPLRAALQVPQAAPNNRVFRARVISFLHRLVECLGPHLLPYLPNALSALMPPDMDRTDLVEVFTLVNQLITRYKGSLEPLLTSVLPEIVKRVHLLMPSDWDWRGSASVPQISGNAGSEEAREMAELHRAFFSLLHFAAANGLSNTLLRLDGSLLDSVLQKLLASAAAHSEAPVRRGCFQVLTKIVSEVGNSGSPPAGYQDFLLQLAGPVAIQGLVVSGLDARDAGVNSLLGDVSSLLQLLTKQGGESLIEHLSRNVLPALSLTTDLQERLLAELRASDPKELKATLRALVQQSANAPPGSRAGRARRHGARGGPTEFVSGASPESNGMMM